MKIEVAGLSEAAEVASILQAAARWLIESGKPLWSPTDFSVEKLKDDVLSGQVFAARLDGAIVGVMMFQLEDTIFWPDDEIGTSAFVHKLAVHRSFSGTGISTELLTFAKNKTQSLNLKQLRLDCVADRTKLRDIYESFGFRLHSYVTKWNRDFARYELPLETS